MLKLLLVILFAGLLLVWAAGWTVLRFIGSLFSGSQQRPGWQEGTRTRTGGTSSNAEGRVTISRTSAPQPKRVRGDVGDYVDYKEEKRERQEDDR